MFIRSWTDKLAFLTVEYLKSGYCHRWTYVERNHGCLRCLEAYFWETSNILWFSKDIPSIQCFGKIFQFSIFKTINKRSDLRTLQRISVVEKDNIGLQRNKGNIEHQYIKLICFRLQLINTINNSNVNITLETCNSVVLH